MAGPVPKHSLRRVLSGPAAAIAGTRIATAMLHCRVIPWDVHADTQFKLDRTRYPIR